MYCPGRTLPTVKLPVAFLKPRNGPELGTKNVQAAPTIMLAEVGLEIVQVVSVPTK
jgi:hypothetical protein